MASSSSPSTPAFSSQPWKYGVFLSFRGEDTRNTFVSHLYSALEQEGIYTYKDDETLPRGESIRPSLMKAIEESQIAVIVFSRNYGDSSWCLDELAHIMKCRDALGQIVMPIFYDVDPSEVRKQKGKYGEAFAKHKLENKIKVESWRKAFVDASNISGWEPRNIANGDESKGIKQIVVEISQKLQLATPSADENLIGMAVRMQRVRSELQIGSGGVRMIGIWGVGGGGKTTLASSIYSEISSKFDSCCFVENVREESGRYGLGKLKEKILSEMEVNKVGGGRRLINNRYRHRKVLIVLDDVDHLDQLKALAGSHDWFGEGSRIIITTRDKHLLIAHKVNVIHNIILLDGDEAIKLFYKHAPRDNRPVKDYEHLLKEVVSYAGGLPLALAVLGSFLCDTDIDEWKSALARLKEIPNDDIVGKLKISFDGLTKVEKDLFLDIACFFRWENKDEALEILDACGLHPVIGLKVLTQRALITISEDGRIDMHDLVQEMGHHIVRGEYPNNPEKHSRVWKEEDILKICAMDATTDLDMIEAIRPANYTSYLSQRQHFPHIVANMKNLRWIDWRSDFASLFPPRGLCFLRLFRFSQNQLWEGCKMLRSLKIMELEYLYNLLMTPDFDGLPNLERLKLSKCPCLEEIHPSIGRLERLVFLSVKKCTNLKKFPPISGLRKLSPKTEIMLRSLKIMELEDLYNLLMTPDFDGLPNLERLKLSGCLRLEEIHPSIGRLERLVFLSVTSCFNLKKFPPISGLRKLEIVDFYSCFKLFMLSETQEQKMDNLHLDLDNGGKEVASSKLYEIQEENMENVPHHGSDNSEKEVASFELSEVQEENMENLPHLDFDNSGDEVASYIGSSTNFLVNCWRCGCSSLSGVECCLEEPSLPHNNMKPCLRDNNMNHTRLLFFFNDLRNLSLRQCNLGDEDIGSAVWELPNLKKLDLTWNNFSRLSFNHLRLPQLKELHISYCGDLEDLSELPPSIAVVIADGCMSLESFGDISNCKWLWKVSVEGENELDSDLLLDSMLQGNAIEDYFIIVRLEHQIPKGFVGRMFTGRTCTLRLPDDWYHDFCGFLICIVTQMTFPCVDIVMKQEVDEDSLFELCHESNEAAEHGYDFLRTYVGYVSFGSLRHTIFSNSSDTVVTVSLDDRGWESDEVESYVGVELVPRKSKGHQPQTTEVATDSSEFFSEDGEHSFTIQDDSKSSIEIEWTAWRF